uniref:Uncharacterized protein n=1 Tax=Aegilops tauschii subsp. strangulata TaxID=200361 RepID=A0A453DHX2_AEGTS
HHVHGDHRPPPARAAAAASPAPHPELQQARPPRALDSGRRALRLARSAGDELADQTVYNSVYGPWFVDDADVREVLLYRAGLVTVAASVLVATLGAFLPEGNAVSDAVRQGADLFYAAGAGGLTPPSARSSPSWISVPARSTPCSRSATTSSSPAPSPSTASPSTATSPGL